MKNITILGSTGSIGTQTLDIIRRHRADFSLYALVAGTNAELMAEQIVEFRPKLVVMKDEEHAEKLKKILEDKVTEVEGNNASQNNISNQELNNHIDNAGGISDLRIIYGMDGYLEAVSEPTVDLVVAAMVGMIGIRPVIKAIESGKDIAFANKETLVCAGHIIMPLARKMGVALLPVDSEHSAIFQCLQKRVEYREKDKSKINFWDIFDTGDIEKLFLTASGGPFRDAKYNDLEGVTTEQALAHPNWSMGSKITIDSATMINKGLEIIEAKWLFGVDVDDIEVLVQRESIVHSMVGFRDGAVLAQLGTPDMRVPIQYALYYPDRVELDEERLDFGKIASISFEKPHTDVLKGIPLALEATKTGGSMPTVLNAANEYAVSKFLKKEVSFLQIYGMIEHAMSQHAVIQDPTLEDILETEAWTYKLLENC